MNILKNRTAYLLTGGFFLLLDRWLKWQSLHNWTEKNPINKFFGWEPFANHGAAFGLPVPNWLIIILTLPVLLLVAYLFVKQTNGARALALSVLFFGAVSNLIDRLVYGYVADYLRVLTGVVNAADIMIAVGLLFFLFGKGIPRPLASE